jgi:regulator of cell morphogenesis and NO signaling
MTVQTHTPAFDLAAALPADLARTHVAQLARERPGTIRVFQRHRIDFCCGGKRTVAEAAERAGVELARLVDELRPALAGAQRADAWLEQLPDSLADLGKLIVGRYHVALRGELPRLVAMANRVETVHGAELPDALPPLAAEVRALAAELARHMRDEEELLFPAIERVERSAASGARAQEADLETLIAAREDEHVEAGAHLARMRELTAGFVPPEWACNTFRGLYFGLEELERELHEHIHLENNVLFPRTMTLAGTGGPGSYAL